MTIFVIWVVCVIATAILAANKGRSVGGWLLLGLLLGPIALLLAAVVSNVKVEEREHAATEAHATEMAATRKCPFCAERIKLEAIVCRYCGRDVPPVTLTATAAQGSASETLPPWAGSTTRGLVIVGILTVVAAVVIATIYRGSGSGGSSTATSVQSDESAEDTARNEALRSELVANKASLLAQAKLLIHAGTASKAVAMLERFEPIHDPDVTATLTEARVAFLRILIKHEPSRNHQQRYQYLTKLAELLPEDKTVQSQLAAEKGLSQLDTDRALLKNRAGPFSERAPSSATAQHDPRESAPTDDVLHDAAFQKSNPHFIPGIRELIERSGYECPRISALWNRGVSPYGLKLEALCGPSDGGGNSYTKLHYAVYPARLKVNLCSEFGAFSSDCS